MPNNSWFSFGNSKTKTIYAKDLLQNLLNIQEALDHSKFERDRHEIYCFYLFTVLS